MQKKRKSYWSVSEIGPSPLKVDADADDGRVGIWKAPLPGGTAELKISATNAGQFAGVDTPINEAISIVPPYDTLKSYYCASAFFSD